MQLETFQMQFQTNECVSWGMQFLLQRSSATYVVFYRILLKDRDGKFKFFCKHGAHEVSSKKHLCQTLQCSYMW